MNKAFSIPPASKRLLTPPEVLAERLSALVGGPFLLSGKTRTDGSNIRKLVARTLENYPLPPAAPDDSYTIVPPRRKGVPRILRDYVDTCIVTSGHSYNLQVWNRNPASSSVQVEFVSGERLLAKDVRFVFVRVSPDTEAISSVVILSPEYIESKFGRFGKPTIKHQLLISSRARKSIMDRKPPVLFYPDTPAVTGMVARKFRAPQGSIHESPASGGIMSLEILRERLLGRILRTRMGPAATKKRGQALEMLVAEHLGYKMEESELLAGGYPDIRNQALEVKVQDSPTVDLGIYSPEFEESVSSCPGMTTFGIRYLIALADKETGLVEGLVLCPGMRLGEHFSYVSDTSYKCQRSIPMEFFDGYEGRSLYDP